jgi:putative permease
MSQRPVDDKTNLSIFAVLRKWLDTHLADEEAILMVILITLGLWVIVELDYVFTPLIASLIIAYLLQGVVARLCRRGLNRLAAVCMVFTGFVSLLVVALWIILPQLWKQLHVLAVELPRMVNSVHSLLVTLPEEYPDLISQKQFDVVMKQASEKISAHGEALVSQLLASLPSVLSLLGYAVLVPLLVFFLLKDKDLLMASIERLLPSKRPVMLQVWHEMNEQIANYVRGKVIQILIVMAATMLVFQWMGLKYSILLGVLVGFSVIIPYAGVVLATIPVALVAYFQWGLTSEFAWLMVVYLLVQAVDGSIVVPILFSEAVKLHPIVIMLSVLLFGGLWGFWGVFFAIPLATLIKAVMRAWPSNDSSSTKDAMPE